MSGKDQKICRLCLKVSDCDVEEIKEVTREVFNVLLLKINLSITKDSVMCKNCAEDIRKCFDFKASCMNVEDCIVALTNAANGSKIDIKEVFLAENRNKDNIDCHICRFCLQGINQGHYKCLDVLDRDMVAPEGTLTKYVPEMNLDATKDPVICVSCEESLKNYISFVKNCQDVELTIVECCKTVGTDSKGQIKLSKVLHYIRDKNLVKIEEEEVHIKCEGDLMPAEEEEDCDSPRSGGEPQMLVYTNPQQVKMYKCIQCLYETNFKQCLTRHLLFHKDPSEIKIYKCALCTFETKWRDNLTKHKIIHKDSSEVKMYKCDICPYEGRAKYKLDRHMVMHKDPSELKMYECGLCTFWTKRKGSLRRHIARHKNSA